MVFNATFNYISVKSWWLVFLVEDTGEYQRSVASRWQTWSHDVIWVHLVMSWIRTQNFSADMHCLQREMLIQLSYDHDHDGPSFYYF
jgi:hypothetical protein